VVIYLPSVAVEKNALQKFVHVNEFQLLIQLNVKVNLENVSTWKNEYPLIELFKETQNIFNHAFPYPGFYITWDSITTYTKLSFS
jgi:hypothetical protein